MKKTDKKVITRRLIGVEILPGTSSIHASYLETFEDGTEKIGSGYSVVSLPGFTQLNATTKASKKWAKAEYRPDLHCLIHMAAIANRELEAACRKLDASRGLTEI